MPGLTPILPLSLNGPYGYILIRDISNLIKQNLKNLVLTAPGERMMDPVFGVGLRNFLFENKTDSTYAAISATIEQQISNYMPFIELLDVLVEDPGDEASLGPNSITVRIIYVISALQEQDQIDLKLPSKVGSGGSTSGVFR